MPFSISVKEKNRIKSFVVYVLIYPQPKFGGNRTNSLWVLAFYRVRFKWKKLIREDSPKCVNQTCNFYFRPKLKTAISLPIFNLFQWFLFYIRDFIWNTALTEKSKFEENCRSAWGYTVTLTLKKVCSSFLDDVIEWHTSWFAHTLTSLILWVL